jgi:hypothetical protein
MLTGSGVALILRVTGTESGEPWSWRGWYMFALVAALSLISKYVSTRPWRSSTRTVCGAASG